MRVEQFEGMNHQSIVNKFREVRREDYAELDTKIAELEKAFMAMNERDDRASIQEILEKLYKHHAEIRQIDFFDCPEQGKVAARLKQLTQALLPQSPVVTIASQEIDQYRNVQWVTRPQPHVDRLACIWLIRRFINPKAVIHYRKKPAAHEIPFDMHTGEFQHHGNLCTFEVMMKAFDLDDAGLQTIGEIVHEIDLRDGLYVHPQIAGVDALLRGWLLAGFADSALEAHGTALFEGLYVACMQGTSKATVHTDT